MYKSKLQELCHKCAWNLPEYEAVKDGPGHNPRFTATVTVNGLSFESPKDQCRSSKEAQNLAAQIAYEHFSSSGASTSNSKVHVASPNMNMFQKGENNIGQLSRVNETPLAGRDADCCKGALHLYKSRLQHYAQRKNLTFPAYSSQHDGPPHARRFRSQVTIDGKSFECQEFFSTLKEAEHAAAKLAFDSLALNDLQEDEGLYKTLLQELAQKKGLHYPLYDTAKTGPPHTPMFLSKVEVGGRTFQGQEAKTKKQAEMNVAKVAYNDLVTCRDDKIDLPDGHLKSILGFTSSSSHATTSTNAKQEMRANEDEVNARHTDSSVNKGDEPGKVLPASSGCAAEAVQQKTKLMIEQQNLHNKEANTTSNRCSAAPSTYASSNGEFCASTGLNDLASESADSNLPREKFLIFPRNTNVQLPRGASILPCSDGKWVVAACLNLNQNP